MVVVLALIVGYTVTVGLMMVVLATAIVSSQRANRAEMRAIRRKVTRIGSRLDDDNDEEVDR